MKEKIKYGVSAIVLACLLVMGLTVAGRTAITDLAGLAVAQTSTTWKNVRDYLVMDNMTDGVMSSGMVFYDAAGVNADRLRGTVANGILVDPTRLPNTAADNSANSTAKLPVLPCRANAAAQTWTEGNQVPCSTDLSGQLRVVTSSTGGTSPVQGTTLLNTRQTSAANTLNTITLTGAAGQRVHLYEVSRADCTAGTSSLQVLDGATLIYDTNAATVPTVPNTFVKQWPTGLTGTTGNNMIVYVFACGVGNASTVVVQADRF